MLLIAAINGFVKQLLQVIDIPRNQFQFPSWQSYSDGQKTLLLFLGSLPFSIHWLELQETIFKMIMMPLQAKVSWMKIFTFYLLKKIFPGGLLCCLFTSHVSDRFWISINHLEELSKLPLSSLQNTINASKNQKCWCPVWHLGTYLNWKETLHFACTCLANHRCIQLMGIIAKDAVTVDFSSTKTFVLKL